MEPHRHIGLSDLKGSIVLLKLFSGLYVPEKSFFAILYAYVPMWFKEMSCTKYMVTKNAVT